MGQVIDLHDWRRRHPAGAARSPELSPAWRAPPILWAEPMLLPSLAVWRAAAAIWAGTVLAAAGEVGFPRVEQHAPAPVPTLKLPFGGGP